MDGSLRYVVPEGQGGSSVKSVLLKELKLSGGLYRSLKWREGTILRNGLPVRVGDHLEPGDELTVSLPERNVPPEQLVSGEQPMDILFEDEYLLVLNKPAGLPMHDRGAPSLAGTLVCYLGRDAAPHFVNRLDKGTSGLLLAAKNGYIHDRFRTALHTGALEREYRALACGTLSPPAGSVTLPIGPGEGDFRRRAVRADGLPCQTEYETLEIRGGLSLLRLLPRTGRTHQLRVHLSALGCPLAGDEMYGGAPLLSRPALHSAVLGFVHPVTGKAYSFAAPLPEDMAALWESLDRKGSPS